MRTGHPVNLHPKNTKRFVMMIGEFRDGGQRGVSSFQNMKDLRLCPRIDAAFGRRHVLVDTDQCDLSEL